MGGWFSFKFCKITTLVVTTDRLWALQIVASKQVTTTPPCRNQWGTTPRVRIVYILLPHSKTQKTLPPLTKTLPSYPGAIIGLSASQRLLGALNVMRIFSTLRVYGAFAGNWGGFAVTEGLHGLVHGGDLSPGWPV